MTLSPGMTSFEAQLCWKCDRLHPDLARWPGSTAQLAEGQVEPSFSWRQSLTLGRIWIKAPVRIQVPGLSLCRCLQNGLFLQRRSYPILLRFHLKTLLVPFAGDLSGSPDHFSHVNTQLHLDARLALATCPGTAWGGGELQDAGPCKGGRGPFCHWGLNPVSRGRLNWKLWTALDGALLLTSS